MCFCCCRHEQEGSVARATCALVAAWPQPFSSTSCTSQCQPHCRCDPVCGSRSRVDFRGAGASRKPRSSYPSSQCGHVILLRHVVDETEATRPRTQGCSCKNNLPEFRCVSYTLKQNLRCLAHFSKKFRYLTSLNLPATGVNSIWVLEARTLENHPTTLTLRHGRAAPPPPSAPHPSCSSLSHSIL